MLTSVDGLMDHEGKRIPVIADVQERSFRFYGEKQVFGRRHGLETRGRKTCDHGWHPNSDCKRPARRNHSEDRDGRASWNTISCAG